jgi:hypothetical protein
MDVRILDCEVRGLLECECVSMSESERSQHSTHI